MPMILLVALSLIAADNPKPAPAQPPVSFMRDVAPILVRNCVACHNTRKIEGKYVMTTYAQLVKGGPRAEGASIVPGKVEESDFVDLLQKDANPRMPWKQDPLPAEAVATIARWVAAGAPYDGKAPTEDWTALLRRQAPVTIPESYPVAVPITALAYAPKGDAILAGGYHELSSWKVADGTLAGRVRPLPERAYEIAVSPDGKMMATAGGDPGQFGLASLWSIAPDGSITHLRDLVESTDCLFAVAFNPDGKLVATAGADRAVRVWETATGKEVATIEDHADWVFDLAWSPDGGRIASASRDKTAKVFDVRKKEALATFPGHGDAVYAVAWLADGKRLATAGADAKIRVWNSAEDAKAGEVLGGFGGAVFALRMHPDGKTLLACSADKTVRVFVDLKPTRTLSGSNDWLYSLALSPDGKSVAAGSWDGEVRTWTLADGKPSRTILAAPNFKPRSTASAR